jgi:hypothetical protein
MFDHLNLRVPDLAAASAAFTAVLDALEIEQTMSTSFSLDASTSHSSRPPQLTSTASRTPA